MFAYLDGRLIPTLYNGSYLGTLDIKTRIEVNQVQEVSHTCIYDMHLLHQFI